MWKYQPEYDTRISDIDTSYDVDGRLGELLGDSDHIALLYENVNNESLWVQQAYPYFSGHRSFVRHMRKHKLRNYIKLRKIDVDKGVIIGVCRLSIFKPEYIVGYNENMILTDNEIDMLIDSLYQDDMYNWKKMIHRFNYMYSMYNVHYHIPNNLKIPDYNKLECINNSITMIDDDYKNQILSTPIPDYTKLKDIK